MPVLTRRVPVAVALLLLLATPPSVEGQEEQRIRALIEVGVGATSVHGDVRGVWAFGVGLRLAPNLSAGGAGHLLTSSVALGDVEFREVELDFGYGGLFARLDGPAPFEGAAWWAGLLVGAGNADVRERATRMRLDSDNFLVAEPSVGVEYHLWGPLRTSLGLSYRTVFGVEDLRGVRGSDLRALSVGLRVRLVPL